MIPRESKLVPSSGSRQARQPANRRAMVDLRHQHCRNMLAAGQSWGTIQNATGCSRATIAKIAKQMKQAA
jgi:DNA invertase Pin-like site-specific DNA recombinase